MKALCLSVWLCIMLTCVSYSQPLTCTAGCTASSSHQATINIGICTYKVGFTVFSCSGTNKLQISSITSPTNCLTNDYDEIYSMAMEAMILNYASSGYNPLPPFNIDIISYPCWWLNPEDQTLEPCFGIENCCTNRARVETVQGNLRVTSNVITGAESTTCLLPCKKLCSEMGVPTNEPLGTFESSCNEECYWTLLGNSNVKIENFLGTTNPVDLKLGTNDYERMRIRGATANETGTQINIGQGRPLAPHSNYMLSVNGKLVAKEIVVTPDDAANWAWPDYVFANNYNLKTLDEVEEFIKVNKHLEDVPAALEVTERGVDLAEINKVLLKKIEELTLYLINMNKKDRYLEERIKLLTEKMDEK